MPAATLVAVLPASTFAVGAVATVATGRREAGVVEKVSSPSSDDSDVISSEKVSLKSPANGGANIPTKLAERVGGAAAAAAAGGAASAGVAGGGSGKAAGG